MTLMVLYFVIRHISQRHTFSKMASLASALARGAFKTATPHSLKAAFDRDIRIIAVDIYYTICEDEMRAVLASHFSRPT